MPTRPSALVVALLLALALLAGCGSSSGSSGNSTATGGARTTSGQSSSAATVATSSTSVGTILVVGGRTVYLFQRDTGPHSTCSGECVAQWPAVTTAAAPTASGSATASMLGTTKRAEGTLQVTYAGHPLYFFANDSAAGQTNGQGLNAFGARWYVVAPSGTAITSAATSRSGGSGYGY
jgi:predicted lipoprotein with Yx(FWY)xxD motif